MDPYDQPTLREYIERSITESWRHHERVHELEQLALDQARRQVDMRLDKLNELRAEVVSDRGEYVRKDIFVKVTEQLSDKVSVLEAFRAKASTTAMNVAMLAGGVGAVVGALVAALFRRWFSP